MLDIESLAYTPLKFYGLKQIGNDYFIKLETLIFQIELETVFYTDNELWLKSGGVTYGRYEGFKNLKLRLDLSLEKDLFPPEPLATIEIWYNYKQDAVPSTDGWIFLEKERKETPRNKYCWLNFGNDNNSKFYIKYTPKNII